MRHRKEEALRKRYQKDLKDGLDDLESAYKEAKVKIDETKSRYEIDRNAWESTCENLRLLRDGYLANFRQYDKDLAYLIAAYRDANLAVRTAEPPPFFDKVPTIDEDVFRVPDFSVPDPPKWSDIPKQANAGITRMEEAYAQHRERFRMLNNIVDDYTEDSA